MRKLGFIISRQQVAEQPFGKKRNSTEQNYKIDTVSLQHYLYRAVTQSSIIIYDRKQTSNSLDHMIESKWR